MCERTLPSFQASLFNEVEKHHQFSVCRNVCNLEFFFLLGTQSLGLFKKYKSDY